MHDNVIYDSDRLWQMKEAYYRKTRSTISIYVGIETLQDMLKYKTDG